MAEESRELLEKLENLSDEGDTPPLFDKYNSLVDPSILIFVKKDDVPPFRFKAGGWELLQSSIKLGPAMTARIAENGFFMCRVTGDQTSWTELTDFPAPSYPQ